MERVIIAACVILFFVLPIVLYVSAYEKYRQKVKSADMLPFVQFQMREKPGRKSEYSLKGERLSALEVHFLERDLRSLSKKGVSCHVEYYLHGKPILRTPEFEKSLADHDYRVSEHLATVGTAGVSKVYAHAPYSEMTGHFVVTEKMKQVLRPPPGEPSLI